MTYSRGRLILGAGFLVLGIGSLLLGGLFVDGPTVLRWLQERRQVLQTYVSTQPWLSSLIFFTAYVLFTALALPGAMVLTFTGGALFGWVWGVVLVSFASTAGATLAMLLSRTLLRDWVRQRYGQRLGALYKELDSAGPWYLLSLRLNPLVPFFLINLAFGLTRMSIWRYWWVSQVGMLPATIIYVWAGTELDRALAEGQFVQARVIAALVAASLLPLLLRWGTRVLLGRTPIPKDSYDSLPSS
ncbi:MAG: TVP38/TMEM64 family protein [Gemmatales bacterium]|nr:TVP38/TMEM64 family protein [Gemmatales bacterium]MDW7995469.1 TVP38/TMEM64 family protein [Gemmatales bacterium]